jgi:hypothetical protein
MSALGLVVVGFAMVVLDVRIDGFDLAPDVVGWVLAAVGLSRLSPRSTWFRAAVAAAAVGMLLGLAQQLSEADGLLLAVQTLVETVLVFSVCSGIIDAARSVERIRGTANLIRWIDIGLAVAAIVLLHVLPPEPVVVVLLAFASLGVAAWFMIFLLSIRDHPALQPPVAPRVPPR